MDTDEIVMPQAIAMRPVEDLLPYARNARTHTEDQVAEIVASMKQFGFTNPLLVAGDDILAGHGRLLAAAKLGLTVVPTIDLSHLSKMQRQAYVLADNKIALNAGWDLDLLRTELEDLQEQGFDLSLTGFHVDELDDLLNPGEVESEADPDAVPEVPEVPCSVEGDLWLLGPHRLHVGDALSVDAWARLLEGEQVDVVWTDPPYNVGYESAAGKIKNDKMAPDAFHDFLLGAYSALFTVMKPGASIYVAHADTEGYAFRSGFLKAGFKLSGCVIWRKNSLVIGRSPYQWIHEPVLFGWKPGKAHRWFGGRKQTTVVDLGEDSPFEQQPDGRWVIRLGDEVLVVAGDATLERLEPSVIYHDKPARSALHPTVKPVGLITRMLRNSARRGDLVADAFAGSGSTLIAAERLGLVARVMELDPRYADVVCARYYGYTGRLPVHAETGQPFDRARLEALNAR